MHESGLIAKDHPILTLSGADLGEANLRGSRTNLSGADLSGTDLDNADLSHADLSGADLSGADLSERTAPSGAVLRTDLRGANLSRADLRGANLHEANPTGANLSGAILAYAIGITNEELEQLPESLEGAILPTGQKYEDWRNSKGRGEDGENSGAS